MTRPTLVSVVIPCFNQGRFLRDCLDSLQRQTYPYWEAIIVNDGSTDETAVIARGYAEQDVRFKYIERANSGQAGARNRGLREASGAYIQFLDADDIIRPEKLELQIDALGASDELTLAYCDFACCEEADVSRILKSEKFCKPRFQMGRPIEDIAARWETELSIPIHCFLFDVRLFRDHGIHFDELLPSHEDWDCWMRIFALDPRVVHVHGELAVYRQHPNSVSRNLSRMRRAFRTAVDAQLLLHQDDPVLRNILELKRAKMDALYAKSEWVQRRRAWWKRWVPWPIQRAFGKMFSTDA